MWRRLANWYREWDEEYLAVLAQPELAANAPAGFRRHFAERMAKIPLVQRQQLLAFSLKYRGARLYWTLGGLALVFSLCGVILHFHSEGIRWLHAIVYANMIGFPLTAAAVGAWFDYRRIIHDSWKHLLIALGCGLGLTLIAAGGMWASGTPFGALAARLLSVLKGGAVGMLIVAVPVLVISPLRNRQYKTLNAQLQREAGQAKLARELAESQLRLLRAQIEPHFLFNTLGAVQQLAQQGAPRAAELTGNLIDFLRSSMRDMRSEQVSLAAEFGLVESYLKVMQVRLGERLRYALQLPRALEDVQLPTMILLTLVENAIKHGIEPALRGGEVTVSAQAVEGTLRIRVQDGGVGMSTIAASDNCADGGGTGLDNVRHRLRLAYGDSHPGIARLDLQDGDPGLVADVTIPHLP
jgi:signal transduction histidine kinase